LDTLTFIQAHFVQENENAVHISWTAILLHTRDLLQPLYQWQASFDPLTRKYEQAKTKDLTKIEYRKLKCLITKQITDDEKVILAGIDSALPLRISTRVFSGLGIFKINWLLTPVVFRARNIHLILVY
jgi:hypothetical protein